MQLRRLSLMLVLVAGAWAACVAPLSEVNRACPCASGWTCCESVCVQAGECPVPGLPLAGTDRTDGGQLLPVERTLWVRKTGSGRGAVLIDSQEVCGVDCQQTQVTYAKALSVEPRPAPGSYFAGWSGPCNGPKRACTIGAAREDLTARFELQTQNLAFVSSRELTPDLGSAVAYDVVCNQLASAAGVNNAEGNAFVAWVSDSKSNVRDRLGGAAGFIRMDGKGFAATLGDMAQGKIRNALNLDETGEQVQDGVLTGTSRDGSVVRDNACSDWTWVRTSGLVMGLTHGGPHSWTSGQGSRCDDDARGRIYCFMRTLSAPLPPAAAQGKKLFVSTALYLPGADPDLHCEREKPAGMGPVKALLSRTDRPLSSLLNPAALYVRLDGEEVGLGSEILEGRFRSWIWQKSDGEYAATRIWTGVDGWATQSVGTAEGTCHDWTKADATLGRRGFCSYVNIAAFSSDTQRCDSPAPLYCVEQ